MGAENNLVITLDDQPGDSVTTPSPVSSGTWDDPLVLDDDTDTYVSSSSTSAKKRSSEESPQNGFNNIMGHQKFCDNCDDMNAQLKSCKQSLRGRSSGVRRGYWEKRNMSWPVTVKFITLTL